MDAEFGAASAAVHVRREKSVGQAAGARRDRQLSEGSAADDGSVGAGDDTRRLERAQYTHEPRRQRHYRRHRFRRLSQNLSHFRVGHSALLHDPTNDRCENG